MELGTIKNFLASNGFNFEGATDPNLVSSYLVYLQIVKDTEIRIWLNNRVVHCKVGNRHHGYSFKFTDEIPDSVVMGAIVGAIRSVQYPLS